MGDRGYAAPMWGEAPPRRKA